MSQVRRSIILKLAAAAYEMDLDALTGVLHKDGAGRWHIGAHDLSSLLAALEDEEIVIVMGNLADERPVASRTCRTCGRDYTDIECPHCRANRMRLRGG